MREREREREYLQCWKTLYFLTTDLVMHDITGTRHRVKMVRIVGDLCEPGIFLGATATHAALGSAVGEGCGAFHCCGIGRRHV